MAVKRNNEDIKKPNVSYRRIGYSRQQMRDTIEGSNAVKRKNLMYLPMPAGFELQTDASAISRATNDYKNLKTNEYSMEFDLPWWHSNSVYRIYLQRARFPDITARSSEGLKGIMTKKQPSFELGDFSYLEESATKDGLGLTELYSLLVVEVLEQGKVTLVVDIDQETNQFYFVVYYAEANIDWDYESDDAGKQYLECSTFVEITDDECEYLEYYLDEDGNAAFNRYDKDCNLIVDVDEEIEQSVQNKMEDTVVYNNVLAWMGKTSQKLPIFNIGSKTNNADCDHIPLLGISDIAISIYQKDADLTHAEHLTCSPTLFMFGFNDENRPAVLGGGVAVTNSNVNGHAEYTQTDTSGLDFVKSRIDQSYEEAASYGASIIGTDKNRNEKYQTARLRTSHSTSTLVDVANNVGKAIYDALVFMADWSGKNSSSLSFEPNTDFIEHSLDAQELTALVNSWIQGAISHDTLLYNFFKAGKLEEGMTIQDEKDKIAKDNENATLQAVKNSVDLKQAQNNNG